MDSENKPLEPLANNRQQPEPTRKEQEAAFLSSDRTERMPARGRSVVFGMPRAEENQFLKEEKYERATKNLEKKLNSRLIALEKKSEDIDKSINSLEGGVDKKVQEARNKIIEPLAIFVGLFTFISVGFQIFAQVREYILWLPILGTVLGGIIIFASLLIYAGSLSSEKGSKRHWHTFLIGFSGIAIFFLSAAYYNNATNILRAEDMKECVLVVSTEDGKEISENYCKMKR